MKKEKHEIIVKFPPPRKVFNTETVTMEDMIALANSSIKKHKTGSKR